jgi:hypothetical protein
LRGGVPGLIATLKTKNSESRQRIERTHRPESSRTIIQP